MPDGMTVEHGGKSAPPPVPEGATELTLEQYEASQVAWKAARKEHREAMVLADEEAQAAAQATAFLHFRALIDLMPEATARLLSAYDGPWPVVR
jgi:hypothetical protein